MTTLIRVFPRRNKATPDDELAFVGDPPLFRPRTGDVHVSCTFTWDKPEAMRLAKAWARHYNTVELGGPAFDAHGDEFVPGRYLRQGYTLTSRGCPNACGFCFVPKREGTLRLLDIKPGWDLLDNNILACPRAHIEAVLDMLDAQPKAARFTGGIEAARVEPWFVDRLAAMRVHVLYMAFDREGEREAVVRAAKMMRDKGMRRHQIGCYVLVGFAGDTIERATERVAFVRDLGITPFAMLFRGVTKNAPVRVWKQFQRTWCRPATIFAKANT